MTTFAAVGQTSHRRRDDAHRVAVTDTQNRNGTNEKARTKAQNNAEEEEDPELLRAKQIALAVSSRGAAGLMSPADVRSIVRADVRQSRIVEEWKREHMSVTRRLEESLTEGVRRVEESILDRLEPNRQQQQQQQQRGTASVGGGGGGVFVARGGVLVKDDDDSLDGVSPQTMTRSLRSSSTTTLTAQKQQPEAARTRAGEQSSRLFIPTASASNKRSTTASAPAATTTRAALPSAQPAALHNQPQKATNEALSSLSLQTSPHTPPNPARTAVASFPDNNNLPPPPPHQHQQQRRRTSSSGSGIIQLTPKSRRAIKGKPKYRKVFSSSSSQQQQHNQHSISPSSSSSSSPQRRHSPRHSSKRTIEEDDDVRRAKLLAMVVSSNPNMTGDEVKMAREVANRKLAQARSRKQQQQQQQQHIPAAAAHSAAAAAHSSTRPEVTERREDGSVVAAPTAQREGRVGGRIVTRSASAPVTLPGTAAVTTTATAEAQADTAPEIDTNDKSQQQSEARTTNTWKATFKTTTACLILKPMSNAWNKIPDSFSLSKSNGIYLLLLLNWSILYSSWYGSFWFSALIANGALFFCLSTRHDDDGIIAIRATSVSSMSRETMTTTASTTSQSRSTSSGVSTTTATQPQLQGEVEERIEALFREAVRSLLQSHPDATSAECRRFLTANDGNVDKASERLSKYLKWRSDCGLILSSSSSLHQEGGQNNDGQCVEKCSSDEEDWDRAASLAVKIVNSSTNGSVANGTEKQKNKANGSSKLPRLVNVPTDIKNNDATPASSPDSSSTTEQQQSKQQPRQRRKRIRAKDGTRLIHVLPAQIDSTIAEPSTYALAVAIYLDSKLDRNSTEKVTVIIDVRGGIGWSNPKPVTVVPFIKSVTKLLNDHFPERLERCILFPLPRAATYLWRMVKAFLDPSTARKMEVLGGPGDVKSRVPISVVKFLDDDACVALEERRVSLFRC